MNPHTELTSNGGLLEDITPLGLHLGVANVLPILIDATYEYQPLSDLASWPNPFTLLNNLAAGLAPTYMLRGLGLDGLTEQLTPQLAQATADVAPGKPLALNLYLTLHSETLPLLEPLYLTSDALNIVGLSPLAAIPMRLANALAPALTILTNIGYANAVQNPDGTYTRDFSRQAPRRRSCPSPTSTTAGCSTTSSPSWSADSRRSSSAATRRRTRRTYSPACCTR